MNVTYHSIYGAIAESRHVFIEAGLKYIIAKNQLSQLNIFEMGFGTGLNAFLTFLETKSRDISVYYEAIETNPLQAKEYSALDYPKLVSPKSEAEFIRIHSGEWNEECSISSSFIIKKKLISLLSYATEIKFDLLYFDAFAPAAQPDLWTQKVFELLFSILKPGGCLVTYCSKGDVRRAMMASGFQVEKLKGAPGKRQMLRASRME